MIAPMNKNEGVPIPGRVLGMFKFGSRNHMEQFAQGLLYMNTLEYFTKIESDNPRTDRHEGTSHLFRGDGAILQIKSGEKFVPIADLTGPIRHQPDTLAKVNVFCMYALRDTLPDCFVSPKNFELGDTFAVVTDFNEFLRRVKAAAPSTGQQLESGLVEYIDERSYQGPVGIFKKAITFSYQSEFRIALHPGTGTPMRFQIADLSDIVSLGPLSELNVRMKVKRVTPAALGT